MVKKICTYDILNCSNLNDNFNHCVLFEYGPIKGVIRYHFIFFLFLLGANFSICIIFLANLKPFGVVYRSLAFVISDSIVPEDTICKLQLCAKSTLWAN